MAELRELKDVNNASQRVIRLVKEVQRHHDNIIAMSKEQAIIAIRIVVLRQTAENISNEIKETLKEI